jgi:hypothetical protein
MLTARWYGELPSEPALSAAKGQDWHVFLHSPGKWAGFSCHDKVVQMAESRLMGRSCHVMIKLSKRCCKNHDNSASASSPIDIVTVAGLVMVPKF